MATIYFYVKSSKLNETLRYGIKLSQNFSHIIPIKGTEKKCMVGLLNPKDDIDKYNSANRLYGYNIQNGGEHITRKEFILQEKWYEIYAKCSV